MSYIYKLNVELPYITERIFKGLKNNKLNEKILCLIYLSCFSGQVVTFTAIRKYKT